MEFLQTDLKGDGYRGRIWVCGKGNTPSSGVYGNFLWNSLNVPGNLQCTGKWWGSPIIKWYYEMKKNHTIGLKGNDPTIILNSSIEYQINYIFLFKCTIVCCFYPIPIPSEGLLDYPYVLLGFLSCVSCIINESEGAHRWIHRHSHGGNGREHHVLYSQIPTRIHDVEWRVEFTQGDQAFKIVFLCLGKLKFTIWCYGFSFIFSRFLKWIITSPNNLND